MTYRNITLAWMSVFLFAAGLATGNEALTAKLIANKDSYQLDEKYSGADFKDEVAELQKKGAMLPAAQIVDFTLRITNTSDKPITIKVGGDESKIDLELTGIGALNLSNMAIHTADYRMGKPTTIEAGKFIDLPIKSLSSGHRGNSKISYFTKPGEHLLTAKFSIMGRERIELETSPAKFKVTK